MRAFLLHYRSPSSDRKQKRTHARFPLPPKAETNPTSDPATAPEEPALYTQLRDYATEKLSARLSKEPDDRLLRQLVSILQARGRTYQGFRALVEKQDEEDPIRSYGLLPTLAQKCSKHDGATQPVPKSKKDRLVSELRAQVEAAERLKEKIHGSPKKKTP